MVKLAVKWSLSEEPILVEEGVAAKPGAEASSISISWTSVNVLL